MTAMKPRISARTGLLVVGALWVIFIWAWRPSILTLTLDDTFYYLKTAVNAANGLGFTFDGINPTNGFHPLWMLMIVPLSAAPIGIDPLTRSVLTLQVVLVLAGVILVERIWSRKDGTSFTGMMIVLLLNFYFTKVLVNGQESALQWFMLCACLWTWWTLERRGEPAGARWLGLGVLAGLTILSRLDAGFFVLGLAAMSFVPGSASGVPWSDRWWRVCCIGAGSAAMLLPYLAINVRTTGHLLPVSGAIKASGVGETGPVLSVVILAAALALSLACARAAAREGGRPELRYLSPIVFHVCALAAYSKIARGAFLPEIWYLVPHMLAVAWILTLLAERPGMKRGLIAALALFSVAVWSVRLRADSYSNYSVAKRMGEWVSRNTTPRSIVAGWDCGLSAAFSQRRFINLDGLINSWDFKERYMDTNRVQEYVEEHEVETIVQFFRDWEFNREWLSSFNGVDLTPWSVVKMECFDFRSIVSPFHTDRRIYLILSRDARGRTLGDLLDGSFDEVCSRETIDQGSNQASRKETTHGSGSPGEVPADQTAAGGPPLRPSGAETIAPPI